LKIVEDLDEVVSCEPYKKTVTDFEEDNYIIYVGYPYDQSGKYIILMAEVIGSFHGLLKKK